MVGPRCGIMNTRCIFCPNETLLRPHHCFFKSQYFGRDKNGDWNILFLCLECHAKLHQERKDMDAFCKRLALSKYKGNNRDMLERIMREKMYKISLNLNPNRGN